MVMSLALHAPPLITIPIVGSQEAFPVRRVYCVGRNYSDHIAELNNERPASPVFFAKQRDELVPRGGDVAYPPRTSDFQYEVELVVAIARGGADIAVADAATHIFGYAVGLDLTRRDLQRQSQETRLPWTMAKSFDQAAPCSAITRRGPSDPRLDATIALTVNGEVKQHSTLSHMLWGVDELVAELSTYVRLEAGDLLFTGTPAGVGPIVRGDVLHAEITGLENLDVAIV